MPKKVDKTLTTRPDLDDQAFVIWTAAQPENGGIDVQSMYRKMLEWCDKKGVTPTRLRLLNWISREREDRPMTYKPAYHKEEPKPASEFVPDPPCQYCGKEICLSNHRKERGI